MKFPNLIHVSREDMGDGSTYLEVHEEGVFDTAFDETQPLAIYKRVDVGEVQVSRRFVTKQEKARRALKLQGKK